MMNKPLKVGEKIKVTEGSLKGVEGHVYESLDNTYVVVELIGCLWASARVHKEGIEMI